MISQDRARMLLSDIVGESGQSVTDFSSRLRVHHTTLYRWLSGESKIPGPMLVWIRGEALVRGWVQKCDSCGKVGNDGPVSCRS